MAIWAIADLHLCFDIPDKSMEIFGKDWENYVERTQENWKKNVKDEDLVLIPGDISWGKDLKEATADLIWIDKLPGTKVLIKGNHDYWWTSQSKLNAIDLPSIHFIHNNVFNWNGVSIAGARLWDSSEYDFTGYIRYVENPKASKVIPIHDDEKIFAREIQRLKLSLDQLDQKADIKIVMCHYPPIGATLQNSKISKMLNQYNVDMCVFGHLHHVDKSKKIFGIKDNIKYLLTSSDYLEFIPLKIL